MTTTPAQSEIVQRVAVNLVRLRKRYGWTAQRVADEMTAAGVPMDRSVVAKLEAGLRCPRCNDRPPLGYACLTCGAPTRTF